MKRNKRCVQFLELKKVRFTSSFAFYSIFKIRSFAFAFVLPQAFREVPVNITTVISLCQALF